MPKVLKAFPGDAPSMSDLIGQCMDGKVYEVDQAEIAGKPKSFVVSCYQKASKADESADPPYRSQGGPAVPEEIIGASLLLPAGTCVLWVSVGALNKGVAN